MRFVELAHPIADGMPVYPGFPPARLGPFLDHAASRPRYQGRAEFHLSRVDMPAAVGTYLDAPFHRYPQGADLARVPLEAVAGLPAVVVDGSPGPRGEVEPVLPADVRGHAVLVRTGWSRHWGTDAYWRAGPWLAPAAVDALVAAKPALVGVDFMNVDTPDDPSRRAHTNLLGAGILIVEHLTGLDALPPSGFRFWAVPPRARGVGHFTVRAFAELPQAWTL